MPGHVWKPTYTLRWDTEDRERIVVGTSRVIHQHARMVHLMGDAGTAWNIAVLDETGVDVTGRFFDHLDQTTA
jgi:hypothetical protein